MWLCKFMQRQAETPTSWCEKWIRQKKIADTDRSSYEMKVYCEIMEHCGCYDQVNLANLSGMEILARRVQLIVDAHELNPAQPRLMGWLLC